MYILFALFVLSVGGSVYILYKSPREESASAALASKEFIPAFVRSVLATHTQVLRERVADSGRVVQKHAYKAAQSALSGITPLVSKTTEHVESRLALLVDTVKGRNIQANRGSASLFLKSLADKKQK